MRWLVAAIGAGVVLPLTFPVLAAASSDGPGACTSALGLRTLGDSESCDTWGMVVSVPAALLVFVLIAWCGKRLASEERSADHRQRGELGE